ncbi:MAG: hypothetical protein JSW34_02155 [Candidatus Zixiibacteriota bacterium]|nr:MAG: hypothetical protein JSW34_02155 [candidate division Zixibacteria bacterium]
MYTIAELKEMLNKKWPEAAFKTTGEKQAVFSTDIKAIDSLFPHGGIPFGQLVEITGPISSGKTSLLYKMLVRITCEGTAVYFDLSNTFFPSAAAYFGVDLDRLVVVRTGDVLEGMRATEIVLQYQQAACAVLDLTGEKKLLPMGLLHRLRMQTVKSKGLVIFLTEDNSHIIPSSIVSLRLAVSRLSLRSIGAEVTKSRVSKEGLKAEVMLYD